MTVRAAVGISVLSVSGNSKRAADKAARLEAALKQALAEGVSVEDTKTLKHRLAKAS